MRQPTGLSHKSIIYLIIASHTQIQLDSEDRGLDNERRQQSMKEKPVIERKKEAKDNSREIWLAGGCFWGMEKYVSGIPGVISTSVGYANGTVPSPSYEQVCTGNTGCAETVHVVYEPAEISLSRLLALYMRAIDPTSLNRQGHDVGEQYRTGVYYLDEEDMAVIRAALLQAEAECGKPVVVEAKPLASYYLAEEYHQEYLRKNPAGYCHIGDALCAAAWDAAAWNR